jgi:hypothetical protein
LRIAGDNYELLLRAATRDDRLADRRAEGGPARRATTVKFKDDLEEASTKIHHKRQLDKARQKHKAQFHRQWVPFQCSNNKTNHHT